MVPGILSSLKTAVNATASSTAISVSQSELITPPQYSAPVIESESKL